MSTGTATGEQPQRVADRYVLVSELGAGGVGKVTLAVDEQTGRRVALKQMRVAAAQDRDDLLTLFKREYYTLKQLAHPLFVEVYEYGVDQGGPFFTMELLSGRDLDQCAPLPWTEVCRILRDVASGLAMLHSRGLVYRDLSARNVRLAENGQAKLLDFGALASKDMAHPKVVGTPPYVAPEAMHGQPLDARTDLYALGALGYFMLTRHHAYSAHRMDQLRDCWRSMPRPPSSFASECPKALDELLLSMLSIDPRARPPHAAEMIDRLVAIAGLPPLPDALAARAYFNRPTLVEREPESLLIRKQLLRMLRGRGGALCIEAAAGMGRTRMLEELVLEAKLLGAVVLHASARAGAPRYEVVRQLCLQLLAELPELARSAAAPVLADLRAAVPDIAPAFSDAPASGAQLQLTDGEERWARAQSALCAWLEAVSRKRALVVAVDDLRLCDDASAGVLAELALRASERRMLVAATMRTTHNRAPSKALMTFRQHARVIVLPKLSTAGALALYRHVFGDVPYLPELASWAERAAGGSVQHCVELAHDLVDRGVIRYAQGVWVLPSDLHDQALPEDMAQAFAERLDGLSAAARAVAESLCVAGAAVSLDTCAAFCEGLDEAAVFAALDELLAADLVVCDGQSYAFRQSAIEEAIESRMDDERRRACHRRVGLALLARQPRATTERFHAARHLLRGGEDERGIDLALAAANAIGDLSIEVDDDAIEALVLALAACTRSKRPRRDEMTLRLTLLPCAFLFDQELVVHGLPAAEQLERDSGMAFVAQQDPSKSLVERALIAFGQANERFLQLGEDERVYDPVRSARELGKALLAMQAVYSSQFEMDAAARCCARFEPLAALTPMAKLCQDAALAAIDALTGRVEPALALQQDVVARAQAMLASMESTGESVEQRSVVRALLASIAYVVALRLMFTRPDESRRLADLIDRVAADRHKASAALLRVLACYVSGDAEAAARYQGEYEQRLVRFRMHGSSGIDLSYRMRLYDLGCDLLQLNAAAREAEALSETRPGYRPFVLLCRAQAFALRGEHERALGELEQAIELARPGKHFAWAQAIVHKTRALVELGRLAEARTCIDRARQENAEHDLGGTLEALLLPTLALLEAQEGDAASATQRLQTALQRAIDEGYPLLAKADLLLATLRVALVTRDAALFADRSAVLRELYRNAEHRGIHGAYKRLLERARAEGLVESAPATTDAHALANEQSKIAAAFSVCTDAGERAQCALTLLVDALAAPSGYLFALRGGKLVLAAAPADRPAPPKTMMQTLDAYLSAELADEEVATVTSFDGATETRSEAYEDGRYYRPILLRVNEGGQAVVAGIAAVEVNPQHAIEQAPRWTLIGALSERLIHEGDVDPARGS